MLALQSQLYRSSKSLAKRTPCVFLFNNFCKKCSHSINVADKDVSEDVPNKVVDRHLRDREISLLGPVDARFPFPGNVGFSSLFFWTSEIKEIEKRVKPIVQWENTAQLREAYARLFDIVFFEFVDYFEYNLVDAHTFESVAKDCPQLLYKDMQLLISSPVFDSKATLVILYRNKNDERNQEDVIRHFVLVSKEICQKLEKLGFWAYFVNPFDVKTISNASSFEAGQRFRGCSFSVKSSNKCTLITRQSWGKDSFVGSLFTNAPFDSHELRAVLEEMTSYTLVKHF